MRPAPFKGNLVVWNLPQDVTGAEVASLFDEHGLVLGAAVTAVTDDAGGNARALVRLAPESAVESAIETLDGAVVGSRKIKVRRARETPKPSRPPVVAGPDPRRDAPPPAEPAAPEPARPRRQLIVEHRRLPRRG
jgi:hypothetical protein